MKPIIPMFYFPLKTLFVDDDIELLKAYHHLQLPNKITTENNPLKAIDELIKNTNQTIGIFNDISDENIIDSFETNEAILSFTFKNIKKLINDNEKYERYGIIVTDYNMPILNGIELCNKINNLDIIKILLTGEYNPLCAIPKLNNNTIDYFLQKGQINSSQLLDSINLLQLKYFKNITQNFFNVTNNKFSFLANPDFATLIKKLISENYITEYYLLNHTGCFLMANNHSKFILNIYSDNDLNIFQDMYSQDINQDILNKVNKRELIPHFELPYSKNYSQYFYPCIKSGQHYYNFSKLTNNNIFQSKNL